MQISQIIDIAKLILESLLVVLGWVFLRRLEQIKSEVARRSGFNQKWGDLFFDAANSLMIPVEQIMTYAFLLISDKDEKSPKRLEWQEEMNKALDIFIENRYRIDRLAVLATSKGPACRKAGKTSLRGFGICSIRSALIYKNSAA